MKIMCDELKQDIEQLTSGITGNIEQLIIGYMPKKTEADASYCDEKKALYVSTTDVEEYDGYITIEQMVENYIEDNFDFKLGLVEEKYTKGLIRDLELAVERLKAVSK